MGPFWGFPVKTVCTAGLQGNPSQQRKRYTTHRGSSQRSSLGSNWAPRHAGSANSTLGRASEMTSDGWCTVFSAGLDSLGGQQYTPFSPEIPQNGQNGPKSPQKGGTSFFARFLSCTSIIFFLVPAGGPKWCFLTPIWEWG